MNNKIISIFIGCLSGAFIWAIFELLITANSNENVTVIVAIITATASIITGIVGTLINQTHAKSRDILVQEKIQERNIQEAHRNKKIEIYSEFIVLASTYMQASNPNNKKKLPNQQNILNKIEKIQRADHSKEIRVAGFDSVTEAKKLLTYYEELLK